jgi:hypothetical protein
VLIEPDGVLSHIQATYFYGRIDSINYNSYQVSSDPAYNLYYSTIILVYIIIVTAGFE